MGAEWVLSGFADEIDPKLSVQLATLRDLRISGLDLRSVNSINVLDLPPHELFSIGDACREAGIHVQCIGSPVNKVEYHVLGRARELERLERAIKAASHLNVNRIRIFTPAAPEGADEEVAGAILEWMREQRKLAQENGMTLLVENDARYWSAYPENAKRLFGEIGAPSFRAAFDFANTVLIGFRPLRDWFPWLLPHLDTIHIKDAVEATQVVTPAGEGDGELRESLEWLVSQGWSGPLTLEPHLQSAGAFGGTSGPELFTVAAEALRRIIRPLGLEL